MRVLTTRQREVVEKAIEMIGMGGLSDLTMRRLAKRLNITEPALYRHFESKNAILLAILAELDAETYGRLPLDESFTPALLVEHFERLLSLFVNRPALACVVFLDEFAVADAELQSRVRALLVKNHDRLAAGLSGMHLRGLPNAPFDAGTFATLLLGGLRLLIYQWRLDDCGWDLTERGRQLVTALTDMSI